MNYELVIFRGAIGGQVLAEMKATSPFMAIAVGHVLQQPGGPALTVTEVAHQFLQPPGQPMTHRILLVA